MKKYLILTIFTALSLILVPVCVNEAFTGKEVPEKETSLKEEKKLYSSDSVISVFNHRENTTVEMNFRDYIIGVVAAEMPVEFHSEALSAGAAAAATLARSNLLRGGDPELGGAVISTDSSKHQAYMSIEEMKALWGEKFDEYYEKLCLAVDKAIDYSITYEGKLIVAAYHAMSPGRTENAENVWIAGIPYLVSVESPGDELAPKFITSVTVSEDEFRAVMEKQGVTLSESSNEWIGEGQYSSSGTLLDIQIGDKSFSGKQLRELFSLRSPAVTLENTKEGIRMTVKGYGHGVGLSQYGADYLAKQGYCWQDIITHYYTGVEITKVE